MYINGNHREINRKNVSLFLKNKFLREKIIVHFFQRQILNLKKKLITLFLRVIEPEDAHALLLVPYVDEVEGHADVFLGQNNVVHS